MTRLLPILVALTGVVGCHTDMWVQPRTKALSESKFYPDGQASRPLVAGTIARDHLRDDDAFFTGAKDGKWLDTLPLPVTEALLKRGQDRFKVYCTPCHGQLGNGKGMIAQRGLALKRPVGNYHTERLRAMPVGYFYDVITNGYGAMYSYASRIQPQDRWAVVAYIRALQLAQHASVADADPVELTKLDQPKSEEHSEEGAH